MIVPVALAVVAALLFVQGFVRLRRRGRSDHAGWARVGLLAAALGVALVALSAPLDHVADERLSAHMLQHVLIGDLAPVLLVLSVRGPLSFFLLPARVLSALSRVGPLRTGCRFLFRPAVAFTVWATVLGVWHVPALYDSVLTRPLLHELEHATFFLGGILVWTVLVGRTGRGSLSSWARLGFAGVIFGCGQALGNVLLLAATPYYPAYGSVSDQRTAAVVMMSEQLLTLGTFAGVQLRGWLRATPAAAQQVRHPFAA